MKKYILIFLSVIFFEGISLSSCLFSMPVIPPNINKLNDGVPQKSAFITFRNDYGKYGYINSETIAVVIPAKYKNARCFVGDFAVVERWEGKPYIINKNNKRVLSRFDHIGLYESENGDFVFALTGSNRDHQWHKHSTGSFIKTSYLELEPNAIYYKIYNVTTGKLVIDFGKRDYPITGKREIPRIRFLGNYMTVESNGNDITYNKDVYEIQRDGSLKKNEMEIDDLVEKIVKEKNMQYNEYEASYKSWNLYAYDWEPDWIGYFSKLDMNKLKENIPQDMELNPLSHPYYIGNFTYPLKEKQLFQVPLKKDRDYYSSIYDAVENKMVISPVKGTEGFYYGADKDWIICEVTHGSDVYYNMRTRKKYTDIYGGEGGDMFFRLYNELGKEPDGEDF